MLGRLVVAGADVFAAKAQQDSASTSTVVRSDRDHFISFIEKIPSAYHACAQANSDRGRDQGKEIFPNQHQRCTGSALWNAGSLDQTPTLPVEPGGLRHGCCGAGCALRVTLSSQGEPEVPVNLMVSIITTQMKL